MTTSPFTQEQIEKLDSDLDPSRISKRQGGGGTTLSYIEGHDAITVANEIFGYGCWGYGIEAVERTDVTEDEGFYVARIRLTVVGCVPITEEGVCAFSAKSSSARAKIDSFDMARKGAITDGLKRALRCFGDQFGNGLYEKPDPKQANQRPVAQAVRPVPVPVQPVQRPVYPTGPIVSTAKVETPTSPAAERILKALEPVKDRSSLIEVFNRLTKEEGYDQQVVLSVGKDIFSKYPAAGATK